MIQPPNLPFSVITIPIQLYFSLIQIFTPPRLLLPPISNPCFLLNLTIKNQILSRSDIREIERYNQTKIMNDGSLFISDLYMIVTVILSSYIYQASKEVCEAFRLQVNQSVSPSPLQANTTLTNPWVNIKIYMVTNVTKTDTHLKTTDTTVGDISARTLFDVISQHLSNRREVKYVKDTHLQLQVFDYTCHFSFSFSVTWHATEIPRKLEDQNMCQNENRWILPDSVNMSRDGLLRSRSEETWTSTINKMKNAFFVDIRYIVILIDVLTSSEELVLFITVLAIVLCSLCISIYTGLNTHIRIAPEPISFRIGPDLLLRAGVIMTLDRFTLEFTANATLNTSTLSVVKSHKVAHRNEVYQKRLLKVKVQHRKHHRKKLDGRRRQKSDSLGYHDDLRGHGRMGQSLQFINQLHNVDKVQLRQQHGWNWTGGLMSDKLGVETGTGTEGSQWDQWTQRPMGSWTSFSGDIGLWSVWRC